MGVSSIGKTGLQALGGLALLALLSGCAMTSTAPAALEPITGSANIGGSVHGGQQPVTNSHVELWAAGATGYGSGGSTGVGGQRLDSTFTDGTGAFHLTGAYTCPSASTLVYITATGGDPGGSTANPNLKMATALGTCGNLQNNIPFVTINEVTTVATAYALGQYFTTTYGSTSTDAFGAPNTTQGQLGITNAMNTATSMFTMATGAPAASVVLSGASSTVTVSQETAQINTIADILSSCVNSTGGTANDGTTNCGTLFGDVAPTGATPPTDTLQAAVLMSLNPTANNSNGSTNNMAALFGLAAGTGAPFAAETTQPTDWTIAIQYKDASFFGTLQNIAVDSAGNVWATNLTTANSGLVEMSPTGTPLANIGTIGGQTVASSGVRNMAIDLSNNVWVTSTTSSGYVYEYGSGGGISGAFPTSKSGYGISIDKSNNVFVEDESSSVHVQIVEFPTGTTLSTTSSYTTTNNIDFPDIGTTPGTTDANGTTAFQPEYSAFDVNGNLWMGSGSSVAGSFPYLVQLSNINTTSCTTFLPCYGAQDIASTPAAPWTSPAADPGFVSSTSANTYTFTSANLGNLDEANGVIAAQGGGVWVTNSATGSPYLDTISLINNLTTGASFGSNASLSTPKGLAMDGSGNIWVANKDSAIGGVGGGTVSEFSPTGAVLSPTSSSPSTVNPGFTHALLNGSTGVAIDPSGNVWLASAGNTSVTEIVGAATPVVTPVAAQLNSTSFPGKP